MAEEINESVAYLLALKRSGGSAASAGQVAETTASAPGTADAAPASPGAEPQYSGPEKRRSPRYKCEGSAELREDGCDVRTWASFTDISLHGCYVEAQATYPVGALLHMKLEANGIKVEVKGDVRVNYPYLGMGIAFVEMSEENRASLREMLGSILRPCVIMGPGIASTLPSSGPLEAVPAISNPGAAIQLLIEFFEHRQMLMREDFLRILRASQSPK